MFSKAFFHVEKTMIENIMEEIENACYQHFPILTMVSLSAVLTLSQTTNFRLFQIQSVSSYIPGLFQTLIVVCKHFQCGQVLKSCCSERGLIPCYVHTMVHLSWRSVTFMAL